MGHENDRNYRSRPIPFPGEREALDSQLNLLPDFNSVSPSGLLKINPAVSPCSIRLSTSSLCSMIKSSNPNISGSFIAAVRYMELARTESPQSLIDFAEIVKCYGGGIQFDSIFKLLLGPFIFAHVDIDQSQIGVYLRDFRGNAVPYPPELSELHQFVPV